MRNIGQQLSRTLSLISVLIAISWTYGLFFQLLHPALFKYSELADEAMISDIGQQITEFGNTWYEILLPTSITILAIVILTDLYLLSKQRIGPSLSDSLIWRNIALMSPILLHQAILIVNDASSKVDIPEFSFSDISNLILAYTPYIALLLFLPVAGSVYFLLFRSASKFIDSKSGKGDQS